MKTFTKKQVENDFRCQVANTFALLVKDYDLTNKNGKAYFSRLGDDSPLIVVEDGKHAEMIITFLDDDGMMWVEYIITKDSVIRSVPHMLPMECFIEEVETDLTEYAIFFL